MSTDANPAESSPAPTTPRPAVDLGSLSPEQRDEWRMTGNVPEPKAEETPDPSPSPAESAPAPPGEQAASTDATSQAASEPAPPKKSNADTRIKTLLAERHAERVKREAAERRLAEIEARQTTPDAKAAPSPASDGFQPFDAWQTEHPDGQYDDYLLDKFKHVQRSEREAEYRAATEQRIASERQTRVGAFLSRVDEALTANPTMRDALNPEIVGLRPVDALEPGEPVTAENAIAQEIMESAMPVKVMAHLSEHPEVLEELRSLSPAGVIRRMAKIEASLESPAVPPTKTVSSAPALTTTLGSRPAVPGDAVQSAIKAGDFSRYREAANAREIAAMK